MSKWFARAALMAVVAGAGIWLASSRDRRKASLDNINKFLEIIRDYRVRGI